MTAYEQHVSSKRTKLLVVGDSKVGKTSLLATLANAGYKVRILDYDSGLDVLRNWLTPDGIKNVNYVSLRDTPKKVDALRITESLLYSRWKHDGEDLGPIWEWNDKTVLCFDSLTFLGFAAGHFAVSENGRDYRKSNMTQPEWGAAVRYLNALLSFVLDEDIACNVVATCLPISVEDEFGVSRDYPYCITRNYSKQIAPLFNNLVGLKSDRKGSRYIRTIPDNRTTFGVSNSKHVESEIEPDLAALFKKLQE